MQLLLNSEYCAASYVVSSTAVRKKFVAEIEALEKAIAAAHAALDAAPGKQAITLRYL